MLYTVLGVALAVIFALCLFVIETFRRRIDELKDDLGDSELVVGLREEKEELRRELKDAYENLEMVLSHEIRTTSHTGGQKGVKLERYDLIPVEALAELARHFGKGARKYEENQWRKGYDWSKSYSALSRHLNAFWEGKEYDRCLPDGLGCEFFTVDGDEFLPLEDGTCYNHTGSHHLTAVAWHAVVLYTFVQEHPDYDDRYVQPEDPGQPKLFSDTMPA